MKVKVPARSQQLWAVSHMRTFQIRSVNTAAPHHNHSWSTNPSSEVSLNQLFVAPTRPVDRYVNIVIYDCAVCVVVCVKVCPVSWTIQPGKKWGGLSWCSRVSVLVARLCRSASGRRCRSVMSPRLESSVSTATVLSNLLYPTLSTVACVVSSESWGGSLSGRRYKVTLSQLCVV